MLAFKMTLVRTLYNCISLQLFTLIGTIPDGPTYTIQVALHAAINLSMTSPPIQLAKGYQSAFITGGKGYERDMSSKAREQVSPTLPTHPRKRRQKGLSEPVILRLAVGWMTDHLACDLKLDHRTTQETSMMMSAVVALSAGTVVAPLSLP